MNSMYGYNFSAMSDSFLVECFDELSAICQHDDSEERINQWSACKDELISRLHELRKLQVATEAA